VVGVVVVCAAVDTGNVLLVRCAVTLQRGGASADHDGDGPQGPSDLGWAEFTGVTIVLELSFTADDLARVHFAVSPLWEVVASVRVLKAPTEHPLHAGWAAEARRRLTGGGLDWSLLDALVPVPTRAIAGFLSPPPSLPGPDLELELAALAGTPPERVRSALDALPGGRPPALDGLHGDPAAGLAALVAEIRAYWAVTLAPHWPRMLTLLQGDVHHRARRLVEGGTGRLLADLDPRVTWSAGTLSVVNDYHRRTVRLDGRGLLLVPSVFVWPRVFAKLDGPGQPTLRYPPRGVAGLWEQGGSDPSRALSAVLGRSRALLLTELRTPATTQDLSRRTGLTAGGVSQHLTALRAAGLVSAHRTGRYVLYARTTVAESLLAGLPA
jgi:DNA-binding transcriptional ArsR family regulator